MIYLNKLKGSSLIIILLSLSSLAIAQNGYLGKSVSVMALPSMRLLPTVESEIAFAALYTINARVEYTYSRISQLYVMYEKNLNVYTPTDYYYDNITNLLHFNDVGIGFKFYNHLSNGYLAPVGFYTTISLRYRTVAYEYVHVFDYDYDNSDIRKDEYNSITPSIGFGSQKVIADKFPIGFEFSTTPLQHILNSTERTKPFQVRQQVPIVSLSVTLGILAF